LSKLELVGYTQIDRRQSTLGGKLVYYFTKPGLPDWETVTPTAVLLAEHTGLPAQANALWLGCGHAATAAALAMRFPTTHFTLLDSSYIATQMAMRTLQVNQIDRAQVLEQISILPEKKASFDTVIIDLPKGRKLAQRWLVEAWYALQPGGTLFLAGANDQGIQTIVKDAEILFGPALVLDYHKGNRVVRWVKNRSEDVLSETDFARCKWLDTPGILPGTWLSLEIQTSQGNFDLLSLPGVFAYDRLDEGTALLLENLPVQPGERILDLGCGYGILGLAALRMGASQVDLVDSNLIAIACVRANLHASGASNARALPSDGLSAVQNQRYDRILSNPPFHAGKGIDYQMAQAFIEQSWQVLATGGTLSLVANRFIRYEHVLKMFFSQVSVEAETGKYRVLTGRK
jgi:16S rRNA (guanine1207-N2)-methyltransferase